MDWNATRQILTICNNVNIFQEQLHFIYTYCCDIIRQSNTFFRRQGSPWSLQMWANARKRQWIRAEGYSINAHRHIWMYRGRHRNLAPHELQPRWHRCRPLTADPCQQLHVCVSSQVHTKLQMVDAEALRSLTPPTPTHPQTSHCVVKLYPWRVFCFSHYKIALAETQEHLGVQQGS